MRARRKERSCIETQCLGGCLCCFLPPPLSFFSSFVGGEQEGLCQIHFIYMALLLRALRICSRSPS